MSEVRQNSQFQVNEILFQEGRQKRNLKDPQITDIISVEYVRYQSGLNLKMIQASEI